MPQHGPQHAATPFARSKDFRLKAHLALRLLATAGMWAAGLCLVIGSIVLIASAASPGRISPVTIASAAQHLARHTSAGARIRNGRTTGKVGRSGPQELRPPAHASQMTAAAKLIAVFSGHGDRTTSTFGIEAGAGWLIQWAYNCPASAAVGLLVVDAGAPTAVGTDISQSGPQGRGDTWLAPGRRTHSLIVISACSWTLRVIQQP
ncbi:MAG TPA: hypothetical protein VEL03_12645 [Streptosporangiaceae bacterium]|nr:hypothetical protein [Streptosporangiaceae bacterium]